MATSKLLRSARRFADDDRGAATDPPLEKDDESRAEHQPGHDHVEDPCRRGVEKHRSRNAADDRWNGEQPDQTRMRPELAPVGPGRSERTRHHRDGVGGTGHRRRKPPGHRGGERKECTAACDRVDCPGERGYAREQRVGTKVHGQASPTAFCSSAEHLTA